MFAEKALHWILCNYVTRNFQLIKNKYIQCSKVTIFSVRFHSQDTIYAWIVIQIELAPFDSVKHIFIYIREARAGCDLKNRLREFLKIVVCVIYVILKVLWLYLCEKKIHHRDYSETGAISKCVSDIAFFVWNL